MPEFTVLGFFTGQNSDNRMRTLEEILHWSDEEIESSHDMIQWMFPLNEPSAFNGTAPILTKDEIIAFKSNHVAMTNLHRCFERFLEFLGLGFYEDSADAYVYKQNNWDERRKTWITRRNHNFLRITRILKCLELFGCLDNANRLFEQLADIYHDSRHKDIIGPITWNYWLDAKGE